MAEERESESLQRHRAESEKGPFPRRPTTLSPLAERVLEELSAEPLSANLILGGGIALKHYDDFRETQDIDAWWWKGRDEPTLERVKETLERVALPQGFRLGYRRFGATDSFELEREGRKEFSFQVALRDVPLEEPLLSSWPPLRIETLSDNVGSKMNALVQRGAPRDFIDIYRVIQDGLISRDECWDLWKKKNSAVPLDVAQGQILTHLTRLEARRPLSLIPDPAEREGAERLRRWYVDVFLKREEE